MASRRPHPAPEAIRVVLADDHALARRSLRALLEREEDIDVVAEAEDAAATGREVHDHSPHVLVLDPGMPDSSGLRAIAELRGQAPQTQVVVVTMDDTPPFARLAIASGAIGYVLKERADEELAP